MPSLLNEETLTPDYKEQVIASFNKGRDTIENSMERADLLDRYARFLEQVLVGGYNKRSILGYLCSKSVRTAVMLSQKRDRLTKLRSQLAKCEHALEAEKHYSEKSIEFMRKENHYTARVSTGKKLLETKAAEYYRNIRTMENYLGDIGFCDELREESIEQLRDHNEKIREEIDDLKAKLNIYEFEPDNESFAQHVSTMREELECLNEEFSQVLNKSDHL